MEALIGLLTVVVTGMSGAITLLWTELRKLHAKTEEAEQECLQNYERLQLEHADCRVSVARLESRIKVLESQLGA